MNYDSMSYPLHDTRATSLHGPQSFGLKFSYINFELN